MSKTDEYLRDLARSSLMLAVTGAGDIVASAGWIRSDDDPDAGRIRKVYVDPRYARRGLASHLVGDAEARARAAGCRRMVVRASAYSVPFYESLGYVALRSGTMLAADGVELPVVFMEKTGGATP